MLTSASRISFRISFILSGRSSCWILSDIRGFTGNVDPFVKSFKNLIYDTVDLVDQKTCHFAIFSGHNRNY